MYIKKYITVICRVLLIVSIFVSVNAVSGQDSNSRTFFLAPDGNDSNPGTRSSPKLSLEAARDAARKAGSGKHTIILQPGDYYLSKTFELDPRDNGLTIETDKTGKVVLYGGNRVSDWQKEGEKFWYMDIPGVREGEVDFRVVIINGRMPERARMPETGSFQYRNVFNVSWLSTVGGGWARKPTDEERLILKYKPEDIPESLDVRNAEVRVYHMWDESLVGVSKIDAVKNELTFSSPTVYPPGGFGTKNYVVYNTREGMTKPGQWYLDRNRGRIIYWPMEGEEISKSEMILPRLESIIRITGSSDNQVKDVSLRGFSLAGTTIPFRSAGMGAVSFEGTLDVKNLYNCDISAIEITNIGGVGIQATGLTSCRITDCHIHHIGGGGVRFRGDSLYFARNHIHHTGLLFPGAIGLNGSGNSNHIYRNEIHDIPYSGMIIGSNNILVEENLIYRVMREIHDGAATYAIGIRNSTFRGNMVRDIAETGEGYGVSAYYFDEGAHDNILEQNVAINVARPIHNHIARNTIIRDNTFITDEDMTLSFQASAGYSFINNTLITPGKIKIISPNAINTWEGNRIFNNGLDENGNSRAHSISSEMPETKIPARKGTIVKVPLVEKSPEIDGELGDDEWAGEYYRLDRELTRLPYSGAPVVVKFNRDKKNLYVGAKIIMFDINNIKTGDEWGKNDGVEISVAGFDQKGNPVTFVIRSFVNGSLQSVTDAGASTATAKQLAAAVKYRSKIIQKEGRGQNWVSEWAIPFKALGIKPATGKKIPFNVCAFVNEYNKWHCWEGTLGESWEIDEAGIMELQ